MLDSSSAQAVQPRAEREMMPNMINEQMIFPL